LKRVQRWIEVSCAVVRAFFTAAALEKRDE
jgi:hypothetical protein